MVTGVSQTVADSQVTDVTEHVIAKLTRCAHTSELSLQSVHMPLLWI